MSSQKRPWLGATGYMIAVMLVSAVVLGSFFRVGMNGNPPTMFRDMVDGTAHKPFVYRVFAPAVIRSIVNMIPADIQAGIKEASSTEIIQELFKRYRWGAEDAVTYAVASGFLYVCLLLFVHAFRTLTRMQYDLPIGFSRCLSLAALAGLPCLFRYYSYIYDFSHLVLFCYALAAMQCDSKWKYFILFTLACFSKETAVLLILVYILYFWTDRRSLPFLSTVFFQGLIFAVIKIYLFTAFNKNPGHFLECHIGHNLTLKPYSFADFVVWVGIIILCVRRWCEKPRFLRCSVWMLFPLLILALLFGLLDEYRDFYEVYPVIALLVVPNVAEYLRIPWAART